MTDMIHRQIVLIAADKTATEFGNEKSKKAEQVHRIITKDRQHQVDLLERTIIYENDLNQ